MPTARELLDQADALMRRNRKRGKDRMGDVPTLTDAFDPRAASIAPTLILPDNMAADPIVLDHAVAQASPPEASPPAEALDPMSLDTLGDVPVLTDAVLDWPDATKPLETREPVPAMSDAPVDARDAFPASAQEAEAAAAELPPPAVLEREAPEETPGPASEPAQEQPTSATTARVPFLDDDFILEIPPQEQGAAQPAPPLAPIVERASAQLIETINRELGELVRGYVAEAIEREIDSWRKQQPKS